MLLKFSRRAVCFICCFVMLVPLLVINCLADDATISVSSSTVATGDELTVSITFTSNATSIARIKGNLTYNSNIFRFSSSDNATGGEGILSVEGYPNGGSAKAFTVTVKFQAISEGEGEFFLTNCQLYSDDGVVISSPSGNVSAVCSGQGTNPVTQATTTVTTTTTTPTTSITTQTTVADGTIPEGKLSSLSISEGSISPAFSYDVLDYTITVGSACKYLDIVGTTSRPNEYIWYTGDEYIYSDTKTRTITVRDSNDVETVYNFNIVRLTAQQEAEQATATTTAPEIKDTATTTTAKENNLTKNKDTLVTLMLVATGTLIVGSMILLGFISQKKKKKPKITHTRTAKHSSKKKK